MDTTTCRVCQRCVFVAHVDAQRRCCFCQPSVEVVTDPAEIERALTDLDPPEDKKGTSTKEMRSS